MKKLLENLMVWFAAILFGAAMGTTVAGIYREYSWLF